MFVRILILAATLFLLGATAAAAATPPTLTGPTAASIATGKPTFTWTNGPTGEVVRSISLSTNPTLSADGDLSTLTGGTWLSDLETVASATVPRVLYAGTYYYVGYWRVEDFSARGYTPLQSFKVPTTLVMGRQSIIQYSMIVGTNISGSFVTNARKAVATCAVYNGTKLVKAEKRYISYTTPKVLTKVYCNNINIPESLDGRNLKLVIKVLAGGKAASKVTYFKAK